GSSTSILGNAAVPTACPASPFGGRSVLARDGCRCRCTPFGGGGISPRLGDTTVMTARPSPRSASGTVLTRDGASSLGSECDCGTQRECEADREKRTVDAAELHERSSSVFVALSV